MINTLKNFTAARSNAAIGLGDLTCAYTLNPGALAFPVPGSGSDTSFYVTVWDIGTYAVADLDRNRETCLVTANSAGSFTWTRGQLGTAAAAHPAGSAIIGAITDQDIKLLASGIGNYADDTGAANAYVATPTMYPSSLSKGMQAAFKAANSNTGASTANIAGTGATTITRTNGAALQQNDILAGMVVLLEYDGTNWQLTNPNVGNFNFVSTLATSPNVQLIGKSLGAGTSVTSITVTAGVATVNHTAHGYATGDWVVIAGATGSVGDINQLHQITVTGANAYTFPTTGTGAIGGTIVEMFWFNGTTSVGGALIKNITRSGAGTYAGTTLNTQSTKYYGIDYAASCSGGIVFASLTSTAPTTTVFNMVFRDDTGAAKEADQYLRITLTGII